MASKIYAPGISGFELSRQTVPINWSVTRFRTASFCNMGNLLKGLYALFLFIAVAASVSWTATPFNPASFPLAVRSPYLSAWLAQGPGMELLPFRICLLLIILCYRDSQEPPSMMFGLRFGLARSSAFSSLFLSMV